MKSRFLVVAGAVLTIFSVIANANAETTTTQVVVTNKDLPNVNQIDFSSFDTNADGAYSMAEVGERLFKCFDQDGNQSIDNIEWDKKSVMTISPMEKRTFKFYDSDDDGVAEAQSYDYETFYSASGLIKFDESQDGLSAADFIGDVYQSLDKDNNNMIDLEEWKSAYLTSRAKHNDPVNYNR